MDESESFIDENSQQYSEEGSKLVYYHGDPQKFSLTSLDVQPLDTKTNKHLSEHRNRSRSQAEITTLTSFFDKNNKYPKKEYLRCQTIRALKRAARQALKDSIPRSKMHQVDTNNSKSVKA